MKVASPYHRVAVIRPQWQPGRHLIVEGKAQIGLWWEECAVRRELWPSLVPSGPPLVDGEEVAETEEHLCVERKVSCGIGIPHMDRVAGGLPEVAPLVQD